MFQQFQQQRERSRSPRKALPGEDWYCPSCCDLQFKNNPACRICGLSRDFGVAELPNLSIDTFVAGHTIDEKALAQFRSLPAEVQKVVMSAGSLHGTRDATAVLISRMSKVGNAPRDGDWFCPSCHDHQFSKNACCRNCGTQRPDDPSLCGPPDAATFLKNHIIDDQVLSRFLALPQEKQQLVIMRGTLNGARDPSAVLSSRITQAQQGTINTGGGTKKPQPNFGGVGGIGTAAVNPMMQMMMQMMGGMQGMQMPDGGMMAGMQGGGAMGSKPAITPRSGDWFCQTCGDHQFAKNALCRNCGAVRPTDGSESKPPDAETFLAVHAGLEDHAISKFRSLDPNSQLVIISRGSLNGARDPNAVLLARIKEVERSQGIVPSGPGGGKGGGITPGSLDWYCPNCYDLQFRNNDSCRICGTSKEFGVKDISSFNPDNFLRGHQIEPHVVEQFTNLSQEMKQAVMAGGSLHGARDPTAVLINRMVKAQCPREGDWVCPSCGDHQFAKNSSCRKCGQPKPANFSSPPQNMAIGGQMGGNQMQNAGMQQQQQMGQQQNLEMQNMMQQMMMQMMQQQAQGGMQQMMQPGSTGGL